MRPRRSRHVGLLPKQPASARWRDRKGQQVRWTLKRAGVADLALKAC
jgi:hypothetical protein